jgi:two-component system cell cycle response regulator DivK
MGIEQNVDPSADVRLIWRVELDLHDAAAGVAGDRHPPFRRPARFDLVTAADDARLHEISHVIRTLPRESNRIRHTRGGGALLTTPVSMEHLSATPNAHPTRVLLVEPDQEARRLYVSLLRPLGCDTIETTDGREALVEALVRRPTLIVMESRLPLVNGPALCEILRRDSLTRTVPILALAADAGEREIERILRAGATSILIKPVAPDALVSELRRLAAAGDAVPSQPIEVAAVAVPLTTGGTPRKRVANSKLHVRCTTTTPPAIPPPLRCPTCDGPLTYERSHLGGVSLRQPEQWDDYTCAACGTFEYRHRTRKLRELAANH